MLLADEAVLNELQNAEREWMRGEYVPWARRQRVLRLAKIGATIEKVATDVKGPIAQELRLLIAAVDQEAPGHERSA
jgi:hypothetical protein